MPLNLSLTTPDSVTGRRTFLIGTLVSTASLFLPWFTGITLGFFGNSNESLNGFQVAGWIPFLMAALLPCGFLATRQAIPRWARLLALLLVAFVIVTEAIEAMLQHPKSIGLTILQAGGLGQWLFIFSQVICFFAIVRFPSRSTT
ncbi:MAG: hypothetical protein ABI600_08790 [Luteolibacter sp.]